MKFILLLLLSFFVMAEEVERVSNNDVINLNSIRLIQVYFANPGDYKSNSDTIANFVNNNQGLLLREKLVQLLVRMYQLNREKNTSLAVLNFGQLVEKLPDDYLGMIKKELEKNGIELSECLSHECMNSSVGVEDGTRQTERKIENNKTEENSSTGVAQ